MDEKQLLLDAQRAFETEQLIAKTKPYPRPKKNRSEVISRHDYTRAHTLASLAKSGKYQMKINQVTTPKHCSVKRLDQLEPIRLKDMLVNQTHTGKYLLCRIVGRPYYMTGMTMLVEDEDDEVEIVSAYNYTASYDVDPAQVLPVNTVVAIKEPYLKIMISDHSNYYIRVESPTDIVVLDDEQHQVDKWKSNDNKSLTYEQLNDLGNKAFVKKEFYQAIRQYNLALKVYDFILFFTVLV